MLTSLIRLPQARAAELKERKQIFEKNFQKYVAGTRPCPDWLLQHLPPDFEASAKAQSGK